MEIKSVTDSVTEYLREQIITGELKPGQRLNETEMAVRINVSRPPLREAFRILGNEQLVVNIPRKATYVRNLSEKDLQEIYQAREMLECYAIDLLKAKKIRELPNVTASLGRASQLSLPPRDNRKGVLAHLKAFVDFHIRLIEASDNPWVIHFYQSISSHLARYQFIYLYIPGSERRSIEEHQEILSLIKGGSYNSAKKFMREHINYTFKFLRAKIVEVEKGAKNSEV